MKELTQLLAQNPYYQTGGYLLNTPIQVQPRDSGDWKTYAAQGLQNLIGGTLSTIGANQAQAQQAQSYAELVRALSSPDQDEQIAIMQANPDLAPIASDLIIKRQSAQQQREAELQDYFMKKSLEGGDRPYEVNSGDQVITYQKVPPQIGAGGEIIPGHIEQIATAPRYRPDSIGAPGRDIISEEDLGYLRSEGLNIPEGVTYKGLGLSERANQRQGVEGRAEKSYGLKEAQRKLHGWEGVEDGLVIPEKDVSGLRKLLTKDSEALNSIERMKDLLKKKGRFDIFGTEAKEIEAEYSNLFNQIRVITNSGANLTGREESLIKDQLPSTLGSAPLKAFFEHIKGQDPVKFLDSFKNRILENQEGRMEIYGLKRKQAGNSPEVSLRKEGESVQDYLKRTAK